ncbi:MAG: hypothetical protein HC875_27330 [Anaerolineales bacterium]|nr:hypothetical protein [Anaerolineales bacterium]
MVKNGLELLEIAVKNDPQDQDAIDKLAGCYLDAVIIGWFPDPDGRSISYPISKTHVDQAEQFIQKAEHLHPQDPDILVYLKERKKLIKDMMRRKFSGRYRPGLALIFLSFFLILAGKILTILFGFGLLITGITYFVACRRPQYITNAKLLAGQGLTVFDRVQIGLDKIGSSIFIYGSITDVIFMKLIFYSLFRTIETVIGMILVPFVTLYCLYENYLADN